MNTEARNPRKTAIMLCGILALSGVAVGQDAGREALIRRGTVQSELDYLRAAKVAITIDLKQVTIRQAYEEIARKTGVSVSFVGVTNEATKQDMKFTSMTLKEILGKLGQRFELDYRVDGPDKLTVIGTNSN